MFLNWFLGRYVGHFVELCFGYNSNSIKWSIMGWLPCLSWKRSPTFLYLLYMLFTVYPFPLLNVVNIYCGVVLFIFLFFISFFLVKAIYGCTVLDCSFYLSEGCIFSKHTRTCKHTIIVHTSFWKIHKIFLKAMYVGKSCLVAVGLFFITCRSLWMMQLSWISFQIAGKCLHEEILVLLCTM